MVSEEASKEKQTQGDDRKIHGLRKQSQLEDPKKQIQLEDLAEKIQQTEVEDPIQLQKISKFSLTTVEKPRDPKLDIIILQPKQHPKASTTSSTFKLNNVIYKFSEFRPENFIDTARESSDNLRSRRCYKIIGKSTTKGLEREEFPAHRRNSEKHRLDSVLATARSVSGSFKAYQRHLRAFV